MSDTKAIQDAINWLRRNPDLAEYADQAAAELTDKETLIKQLSDGLRVRDGQLAQLRVENAEMREALEFIGDLAFDRDGWKSAKKLGELIDEIYDYARNPEKVAALAKYPEVKK